MGRHAWQASGQLADAMQQVVEGGLRNCHRESSCSVDTYLVEGNFIPRRFETMKPLAL